MFYFVSWELGCVLTFWLSAHSVFQTVEFFMGGVNLKIKCSFLLLTQNVSKAIVLKSLYDYILFTSLSFPLPPLRIDWLWNTLQFAFPVTFHQLRNLLCSECSLFSKYVHWQMFLYSPLLLHRKKRKDALANWSCQEIDF